eukprot:2018364-Rhodomonas_salina.1
MTPDINPNPRRRAETAATGSHSGRCHWQSQAGLSQVLHGLGVLQPLNQADERPMTVATPSFVTPSRHESDRPIQAASASESAST